ncbi:hypothetical protein NFI96_010077 [Prochilodus magdalenae]|nr:hypothetical protein NFI96_010077 [Prochilodus magdalenae]
MKQYHPETPEDFQDPRGAYHQLYYPILNTSVMEINSTINSTFNFYDCVKQTHVGMTVLYVVISLCFFVGIPAYSWLFWLLFRNDWRIKPTQVFLLNRIILELIFCSQCAAAFLNALIFNSETITKVSFIVFGLGWAGRPLMQMCISVEQYLAVLHPVMFLKYKGVQYRIAPTAVVWLIAAVYAGYEAFAVTFPDPYFHIVFFIAVAVSSFCCVSVLRALKHPGPGDTPIRVEKGRDVGNQQKRNAFKSIFAGLLVILFSYLPQLYYPILNTSVMEINSTINSTFTFYDCVKQTHVGMTVLYVVISLCFFVGIPSYSWLLWLLFRNDWRIKPTQVFLLNRIILELIFCSQCAAAFLNALIFNSETITKVSFIVFGLGWAGRPLMQMCISVEQYLAVLHPVMFLKYKGVQYRIAPTAVVWLIAAVYAGYEAFAVTFPDPFFNIVFFIAVAAIIFCCVSVLRALKHPGPGDTQITADKGRDVGNQQKRNAFKTIFAGLLVILFSYLPQCFGCDDCTIAENTQGRLFDMPQQSKLYYPILNTSVMEINSTINSTFTFYDCFKQAHVGMTVLYVVISLCFFVGIPAYSWLFWLLFRNDWRIKPTQVFLLNRIILELIFCSQCAAAFLNVLIFNSETITKVSFIVFGLGWAGRPLMQMCISVEQYLAVLHPVMFLKYKGVQYRIAPTAVVWLIAAAYAGYEAFAVTFPDPFFYVVFFIAVAAIIFCCVSVLRALKHPGPGDTQITVEKGRDVGNQQKRNAFKTIFAGLLVILFSYLPQFRLSSSALQSSPYLLQGFSTLSVRVKSLQGKAAIALRKCQSEQSHYRIAALDRSAFYCPTLLNTDMAEEADLMEVSDGVENEEEKEAEQLCVTVTLSAGIERMRAAQSSNTALFHTTEEEPALILAAAKGEKSTDKDFNPETLNGYQPIALTAIVMK